MSQTSEWKMSFVILVSAARRLADMALWLQSPFEMELGGRRDGTGGSFTAQWHLNSAAKGRRPRQLENDADAGPPGVLLLPLFILLPHPPNTTTTTTPLPPTPCCQDGDELRSEIMTSGDGVFECLKLKKVSDSSTTWRIWPNERGVSNKHMTFNGSNCC